MPSTMVKNFSLKSGKSEQEVENIWNELSFTVTIFYNCTHIRNSKTNCFVDNR